MKHLYKFFKALLIVIPALLVVYSIYIRYDFVAHPEVYAVESAPWYLAVIVAAAVCAVAELIVLIVTAVIKRKLD